MDVEVSKRSRNFTDYDRNLLFELVIQYKHVLENKKTDGTSVKQKNEAWDEIPLKYNSSCQTSPRNAKQLHALYDGIKKKARKIYMMTSEKENIKSAINVVDVSQVAESSGTTVMTVEPTLEFSTTPSASIQTNTPQSLPEKKRKRQSIETLSKRIVERKNFKDKLNTDIHKKKEEILDVEKILKEKQLTAANIDVLIKEAELKIKEKDIQIKMDEISHKKKNSGN
ncbi:hypothetical protein NQ314_005741 [Rhamnusium bicolor]|uniref:Regulatory protein zeste n=1 Tax=Rhamnusium bicolor TaxID=1586634 RepID=A0AAV8ZDV1_9CUCU|nr:hypothetical protein NQ314_005741 [Rhamnusium bicolor]